MSKIKSKNNQKKIFSKELRVTEVFSQLLLDRGIDTLESAKKFLEPSLKDIPNPNQINFIYDAAEFIYKAIKEKKKICVYGDYDLDGISSTAVLKHFFLDLGVDVIHYIPDRVAEGYALSKQALDYLKKESVDLIITVDSGITNVEEALYAKEIGLDLIITDHHEPQNILPDAILVNPKLNSTNSEAKLSSNKELESLAGVGVAFYLLIAIRKILRNKNFEKINTIDIKKYLWLVAIGTIADMVPLLGVNRIFVHNGLKQIRRGEILALNLIAELDNRIDLSKLTSTDISFLIAPKLNAAGRIANTKPVLDLFLTDNIKTGKLLIEKLDEYNKERVNLQNLAIKITDEELLENLPEKGIPVLYHDDFHQGIIGIVASRFVKKLKKPVLVCAQDGESQLKCSFRSYNNVNLLAVIEYLKENLLAYGGHKGAAGFSIKKESLDTIKQLLVNYDYSKIEEKEDKQYINLDIDNLTEQFTEELDLLEPYGFANKKPLFKTSNLLVKNKRVLKEKHIKLSLENNIDAIGFNLYSEEQKIKDVVDITFYLEFNHWNGRRKIQLNLQEME